MSAGGKTLETKNPCASCEPSKMIVFLPPLFSIGLEQALTLYASLPGIRRHMKTCWRNKRKLNNENGGAGVRIRLSQNPVMVR